MEIQRDRYLNQIRSYMWDGQVKVITGIRRCGKSYLLFKLFRKQLLAQGVPEDHIITIALDLVKDIQYRNPLVMAQFVRSRVENSTEQFYLFVDEIQMSDAVANPYNHDGKKITFYDALNDLKSLRNLDVYVTGSNSKMLSSDILTEFRGRSDEIHVHPLSFGEYYRAVGGDKQEAFDNYAFLGGMPLVLSRPTEEAKMKYLKDLFFEVYIKDIVERKKIKYEDVLSDILDLLCSSIGSLTNPTNVANTLSARQKRNNENAVANNTVKAYMNHLADAFLFSEVRRWDVKGKRYFDYPNKYSCEDIGIVYGYSRDSKGRTAPAARELDFIANRGGKKTYIQSAYALPTEEKAEVENRPFGLVGDSFPKIIVRHDIRKRWYDDNGVLNIGIIDFLLDENCL